MSETEKEQDLLLNFLLELNACLGKRLEISLKLLTLSKEASFFETQRIYLMILTKV